MVTHSDSERAMSRRQVAAGLRRGQTGYGVLQGPNADQTLGGGRTN